MERPEMAGNQACRFQACQFVGIERGGAGRVVEIERHALQRPGPVFQSVRRDPARKASTSARVCASPSRMALIQPEGRGCGKSARRQRASVASSWRSLDSGELAFMRLHHHAPE